MTQQPSMLTSTAGVEGCSGPVAIGAAMALLAGEKRCPGHPGRTGRGLRRRNRRQRTLTHSGIAGLAPPPDHPQLRLPTDSSSCPVVKGSGCVVRPGRRLARYRAALPASRAARLRRGRPAGPAPGCAGRRACTGGCEQVVHDVSEDLRPDAAGRLAPRPTIADQAGGSAGRRVPDPLPAPGDQQQRDRGHRQSATPGK